MNANQLAHVLPDLQPVGWLSIAMMVCGVAAYGFKGLRFLYRLATKTAAFLDDWNGEQARPGFPARPGIPERISRLEVFSATAQAQLQTNGGLSLRDQTNRIEKALNEHIAATSGHE